LLSKLGDYDAVGASILNRQPDAAERRAAADSGERLALFLASPAFQRC
jgi:hypothetical protein